MSTIMDEYPDMAYVYALSKDPEPDQKIVDWAQTHVQDWMKYFRIHFRPPKGSNEKPIRRDSAAKPEDDSLESMELGEDPLYWRNLQPWSRKAFEFCLLNIRSFERAEVVACVLPPLLQLAEDHEVSARISGLKCLIHLVRLAPALVVRMGLADLVLQILKVNMSFNESAELIKLTADCLNHLFKVASNPVLPGWKAKQYSPQYFEILDEFLDIFIHNLSMAKIHDATFRSYIYGIKVLIDLEQLGTVRFLPVLLAALTELVSLIESPDQRNDMSELFEQLKQICAPRIQPYHDICNIIEAKL